MLTIENLLQSITLEPDGEDRYRAGNAEAGPGVIFGGQLLAQSIVAATAAEPGKYVDHWVTEYWNETEQRWVRIDAQLDDVQRAAIAADFDTEDLPPGPFLPAGEAWEQCRTGRSDPDTFGIFEFWGLWFVQANVVRELAALNKMELLPWDVWGAMTFQEEPDATAASLTDTVAVVIAGGDIDAIRTVYEDSDDLRVPDEVFDARFEMVHSLG